MANDFISGYYTADESLRRRAQEQRQTLAQALAMKGAMQQQQQDAEMNPLRRKLLEGQIADVEQKPEDRVLARQQVKELALARLDNQRKQFYDNLNLRQRMGEDNLSLKREAEAFDQQWKIERLRQGGAEASFNFGLAPPQLPTPTVSATQAPPQPNQLGGLLVGRPPAEQAALTGLLNAGANEPGAPPMRADVGNYQPPQAAPAPAPMARPAPAPLGNEDMQDRRMAAQARLTPSTPIPSTAVTTPAQITLADAPKGLTPRAAQQWLLQQTKPSIAGGGQLNPQALEFTAKQYLAGDRQAVQGYARNATARIALQNAIVDEAAKQGMSPSEVAAKMADFAGVVAGSRTVGQRAANISLAATEAQEMIGIVKETSDKFGRTNFVPWNMALRAYESGTGTPEIAAFGASINALVNVYARAINPTGVPTVSDKEHARAVLNSIQSPAQVDAVLGIIRRELEIAKKAPQQVREATKAGVTGGATRTRSREDILKEYGIGGG